MIEKQSNDFTDPSIAAGFEWLETNGLGGWSGSSIIGMHTRRYHGLLVAATHPPDERKVLISKLDETVIIGQQRTELSTNDYGDVVSPKGYQHLKLFTRNIFPEWLYMADGIKLRKTIGMIRGENSTFITYEVLEAEEVFTLELLPLLAFRGYHELSRKNDSLNQNYQYAEGVFSITPYTGMPTLYLKIPGAQYQSAPDWYYHLRYAVEEYRGQEANEDLFCPGRFTVSLKAGDKLGIILSTENPVSKDAFFCMTREKQRKQSLLPSPFTGTMLQYLLLSADQFIVQKGETLKTVIAGYHWFTDWGRDTMIALPGLCLATGRYEDAKCILTTFAGSISEGMLPNRFCDGGNQPEYNTVDATLWFFVALYQYQQKTGDHLFVETMLPVLENIIQWHINGTRYRIKVSGDGLLYAGEPGVQLTWMDAKAGDWVVTPRTGKPVEIQALWYNALCIYQLLSANSSGSAISVQTNQLINLIKQNFEKKFWDKESNGLFDCLNEKDEPVSEIRPNQLFAISLPYPLLEPVEAIQVLIIIKKHLLTPAGLRSLSREDPKYQGNYGGNQRQRDGAYHQGTVWGWLLGPYIDAVMRYQPENGFSESANIISAYASHLEEACMGSIAEIFDGDPPHHPRGCVSQAWSVAELIRVIKEYRLEPAIYT